MGENNDFFLKILKEKNIRKNYPACKELSKQSPVEKSMEHFLLFNFIS